MGLKRAEYWAQGELPAFLRVRAELPFVWGKNDCALFAADAIWSFTGVDIASGFRAVNSHRSKLGIKRGRYGNEDGAFALIAEVTGKGEDRATAVGDAAEYCAVNAGLVEWKSADGLRRPLLAQRGDLVVVEDGGRLIAGIVHLNGREAVSVGENGLKRLPMDSWRRAWKV